MGWLGSFFKKLWSAIRKVLAVILIIAAIIIAVWATLITGGATLPLLFGLSTTMMYVVAGLCLVGAFIVDKKTATKTVGKVADAVGDAANAVGTIGGAAVGGILGGIFDNPIVVMAAVGVIAYLVLSNGGGAASSTAARPALKAVDTSSKDKDSDIVVGNLSSDDIGVTMYA